MKSHSFRQRHQSLEQIGCRSIQSWPITDDLRKRPAAGYDLEISKLDLQRDRPPTIAGSLAMASDLVDERLQRSNHGVEVGQIVRERVLRTDGFTDAVCAERTLIDPTQDPVVVGPLFTEVRFQDDRPPVSIM